MADLNRLSINQATTRDQHSLMEAVECYARHEITGISIWRDKLDECGLDAAAKCVKESGLRVSGLCRAGQFPALSTRERRERIDDNKIAIEQAATLAADCLIIVAGGLPAGSKDLEGSRAMISDAINELMPFARSAGVKLAIEPLHPMYAGDRCAVNTLSQALDLCDELGSGAGVAVDVYHTWWDPDLYRQISRAGKRIYAFHVCDWLVPTKDLLLDRGMMGDGVIDIKSIANSVNASGYKGLIEVEIFSALNWWKRPGDQVVQTCKERFMACV